MGRKREGGWKAGGHLQPTRGAARRVNGNLPSGTRAQGSVLSGRGESSRHGGATTLGRHRRGIPRVGWMETKGGGVGRWAVRAVRASGARRGEGQVDQDGGMGQQGKQGRSCPRGWAQAGACTCLAAGMAADEAPQASRSCWQPARAAASRATCAAGRPPLPGTPVRVGQCGKTRTRRRNRSASGAQPASRSQRQAGRHLHSTCGGRRKQCWQPSKAAAGSGWGAGHCRGRAGPENQRTARTKIGGGKGTEHRRGGPKGALIRGRQVEGEVGLPRGGSPQKGQRRGQGK